MFPVRDSRESMEEHLCATTLENLEFLSWLARPAGSRLPWRPLGLVASDQYLIGPGSYSAGSPLKSEPSVGPSGGATGFASGSTYNNGSGSVNWLVNSGGINPNDSPNAGNISFDGYTSDNGIRSGARALNTFAAPSTLWFGITVSQDGTSTPFANNGYALAGFGNSTPPTLGATTTTGMSSGVSANLFGLFFGFAHEPGDPTNSPNSDLVIRYRNSTGATAGDTVLMSNAAANTSYTIIAEVQVNASGAADLLTYWVNPTNASSIAALDNTSMLNNDGSPVTTYGFQGNGATTDLTRLNYSAQNWGGDSLSAQFGDPTLGTTLADVAPLVVPEPRSFILLALGMAGGVVQASSSSPSGELIDPEFGRDLARTSSQIPAG